MGKQAEFWQTLARFPEIYVQITLPRSTAEVERTFSKLSANKTNLRSSLVVSILEVIIKTAETTPYQFNINARLTHLYTNARKTYMKYIANEQAHAEEDFE